MKKLILSLFLGMCAFCLFAQAQTSSQKPVIVITPVDLYDVDEKSGDLIFRRIQSEFVNTYRFAVVDRGALSKILAEKEFQDNSDWSSPEKVARLKEAFNAQYIVTSVIESYDDIFFVTINIIDVNTTQIIASENSNEKSVKDLMSGKLKDLVVRVSSKVQTDSVQSSYPIGGMGEGGGIVFYYSKEGFPVYSADGSSSTFHYLECSYDVLGKVGWGIDDSINTKNGIGYGKLNTKTISDTSHSTSDCAAKLCLSFSTMNTSAGDWWLPSKDELNLIYENLKKQGFIEGEGNFWSSSSYNSDYAWFQDFSKGYQNDRRYYYPSGAPFTHSVRAIRAF